MILFLKGVFREIIASPPMAGVAISLLCSAPFLSLRGFPYGKPRNLVLRLLRRLAPRNDKNLFRNLLFRINSGPS